MSDELGVIGQLMVKVFDFDLGMAQVANLHQHRGETTGRKSVRQEHCYGFVIDSFFVFVCFVFGIGAFIISPVAL